MANTLEVTTSVNDSELTVTMSGRIDTTTAPSLEAAINEKIAEANTAVIDFNGVDYISSAGLRVLLSTQKAMSKKGGLKLIHVESSVQEIFEVTGFSDILTIE